MTVYTSLKNYSILQSSQWMTQNYDECSTVEIPYYEHNKNALQYLNLSTNKAHYHKPLNDLCVNLS